MHLWVRSDPFSSLLKRYSVTQVTEIPLKQTSGSRALAKAPISSCDPTSSPDVTGVCAKVSVTGQQ